MSQELKHEININQILLQTEKNLPAINTFFHNIIKFGAYSDKNILIDFYFGAQRKHLTSFSINNQNQNVFDYNPPDILTYRIRLIPNVYKFRSLQIFGEILNITITEVANDTSITPVATSTKPFIYFKPLLTNNNDIINDDAGGANLPILL